MFACVFVSCSACLKASTCGSCVVPTFGTLRVEARARPDRPESPRSRVQSENFGHRFVAAASCVAVEPHAGALELHHLDLVLTSTSPSSSCHRCNTVIVRGKQLSLCNMQGLGARGEGRESFEGDSAGRFRGRGWCGENAHAAYLLSLRNSFVMYAASPKSKHPQLRMIRIKDKSDKNSSNLVCAYLKNVLLISSSLGIIVWVVMKEIMPFG